MIVPSWSSDCTEGGEGGEGGRRGRLLYLILIKDRGKEGRERRRWLRASWTSSLPPGHRHVFVTVAQAGQTEEALEAESELYDDLLVVDIPGSDQSDLYTEHRQRVVALHFSSSVCRAPSLSVLLDQTVLVNPAAMQALAEREDTAANRQNIFSFSNISLVF